MLIDLTIALLLISIVLRGRETGLVRQAGSAIGFISGLFLGAALQPQVMAYADTTLSRVLLSLTVLLGSAFFFMNLGEFAGSRLKRWIMPLRPLDKADAILGSVAGVVTLLAAVWLLAPVLGSLPSVSLQQSLRNSAIVTGLDQTLPSAPEFISRIDRIINPNGFPDVFAGLERQPLQPDTPLPSLGEMQTAVEATRASIVKMEGRGCGGIVEGSGFVAAPGIVITNAHVVAGVERPSVVDTNGRHAATVIWFDDKLDMAVVRTNDLAGGPLGLSETIVESGSPSVVVGYPGGGGFTASPSTVLDQFTARGRDIYGRNNSNRSVYELRADIIPGNSGGPLLDKQGNVIGLVFAESVNYDDVGYALTMGPVIDGLEQAQANNRQVATGACAG